MEPSFVMHDLADEYCGVLGRNASLDECVWSHRSGVIFSTWCDRVLIVPSRWRHCYNDDTVSFNYFTFIYSFVLLGHELYYIMLLLVSYCIFPVQ